LEQETLLKKHSAETSFIERRCSPQIGDYPLMLQRGDSGIAVDALNKKTLPSSKFSHLIAAMQRRKDGHERSL